MPEGIPQVVVLILFVIPGFIFTRIVGFSIPLRSRDTLQLVLDSIAVSCINYALLSPLVWTILRQNLESNHPVAFVASWFGILFAFPVVLAVLTIKGIEHEKFTWLRKVFSLTHPVPTAWDYFFRRARPCWVMATLKNGKVVAGLYSGHSFASSYPDAPELYLEQLCNLSPEAKMIGLKDQSEGAIIRMDQVQMLEFYSLEG